MLTLYYTLFNTINNQLIAYLFCSQIRRASVFLTSTTVLEPLLSMLIFIISISKLNPQMFFKNKAPHVFTRLQIQTVPLKKWENESLNDIKCLF